MARRELHPRALVSPADRSIRHATARSPSHHRADPPRLRDSDLAAGPARLTVALGIALSDAGAPLDGTSGLTLTGRQGREPRVAVGPRIGVGKATDFPLRFWIDGDPTVSR